MFNLEQAIADWRRQMLAAGIKTPVPLEELEGHLREEIERQMKLGLSEQKAFEDSILRIGQPEILGNEFKKSEGIIMKIIGIFVAVVGAVIISRILTEHPDAGHLWTNEQTTWLVAGSLTALLGIGIALIKAGSDRGLVRLWKLIGVGYSIFASAFSIFLTTLCIANPGIRSAFTIADWILILSANAVCIFSIAGLRQGCALLPVVRNLQARMAIGIAGPPLGALWMLAALSLLGGLGYGLEKAARKSMGS